MAAMVLVGLLAAPWGGLSMLEPWRAALALERGEPVQALEIVEAYLHGPGGGAHRAEARLIGARVCLELRQSERALELLSGIEGDLPEVVDIVLGYRAWALRLEHRWEEALRWWRDLVQHYPESPLADEARYGIADGLYALGRIDEAAAAYEAALRAAPRSERRSLARLNLANIAAQQRHWVTAATGYSYLANFKLEDPVAEIAAERLAQLVKAGHARPLTIWQQLARLDIILSSGSVEEAQDALDAAAPLVDLHSRAAYTYRRAKLAYRKGELDTAAKMFADLAAGTAVHSRDRVDYEQWLARTYSTQERYGDAIRTYLGIADREAGRPDAREALFKAAWLAYHTGDHARALELFGRFVAAYPRDRSADEALWYLAWNAYRAGDVPLALANLSRLQQEHPDSSLVQRAEYWQARFALASGDLAGARAAFHEARVREPLSYYGVLAGQRLRQLEDDRAPVTLREQPATSAETSTPGAQGRTGSARADHQQLEGQTSPIQDVEAPPWGPSVLDWRSPAALRVLRLARLGFYDLSAEAVSEVPSLARQEAADIVYARARVLYALGDFGGCYRLTEIAFGDAIRSHPWTSPRRYFRLAYPDAYAALVDVAAHEFSISPLLLLAVMRQESGFDDRARSAASAHGLMQIIPLTANHIAQALRVEFRESMLRDPAVSVRFGAWYLAQLLRKFGGDVVLALSSYNAGPQAVESWVETRGGQPLDEFVEEIPFRETRFYVKRVIGNLAVYAWLYGGSEVALHEQVPGSYLDNVSF